MLIRNCSAKPNQFLCANRGFTLLELLVVMVIIGLLAGYVGPKYFAQIGKSEVKAARAQIDSLGKALDQFRLDTGHYPTPEEGLASLVTRQPNEPKWEGPYLSKEVPVDPWGNLTKGYRTRNNKRTQVMIVSRRKK